MMAKDQIRYRCSRESFRPARCETVRWLDCKSDWPLMQALWQASGFAADKDDWIKAHDDGYEYCAVVDNDEIAAIAAVWRYSDEAREVAAVHTNVQKRRCGLGKAVVSFVTEYILSSDRTATCGMRPDNVPMMKTAESVGFTEC